MVKHTQTIRPQIADKLFECVWPFCGIGTLGLMQRKIKSLKETFDNTHYKMRFYAQQWWTGGGIMLAAQKISHILSNILWSRKSDTGQWKGVFIQFNFQA